MSQQQQKKKIQVILVGDYKTGKISILQRYFCQQFQDPWVFTCNSDFRLKNMKFEEGGEEFLFIGWGSWGAERFQYLTKVYYKLADGIHIVYDITNRETFKNAQEVWLKQIQQFTKEGCSIMLLGSKCDMEDQRQVSIEEGKQFAEQIGAMFYEVSAKEDINITGAYEDLAYEIYKKKYQGKQNISQQENIKISNQQQNNNENRKLCQC